MRPGERDKDFKHANGIFLNKSAKAMDFLGSSSDRGFRTYSSQISSHYKWHQDCVSQEQSPEVFPLKQEETSLNEYLKISVSC